MEQLSENPFPTGSDPKVHLSVCLSVLESMTRLGQELCFVVYPQGTPEEEENGPCQLSSLLSAAEKPLKMQ